MKWIGIIGLALMLGCLKVKPKGSGQGEGEQGSAVREEVVVSELPPPKFEIIDLHEYNKYQVRFSFSHEWPKALLMTQLNEAGATTPPTSIELRDDHSVTINLQRPGQPNEFRFWWMNKDQAVELAKIQLQEPQDLYFRGQEFLAKYTKEKSHLFSAQRIYFADGVELLTEDLNLNLRAAEIVFENTVIRSFKNNQKAELGKPGRHAGMIRISAQRLVGSLHIATTGEHGGDGLPAPPPDQALRGADGAPGTHGKMGDLMNGCSGARFACNVIYRVAEQPTNGGNARDGYTGYSGGDGRPGGNSAAIFIKADDKKDFVFSYDRQMGQGGEGAPGGQGGEPGTPGRPGECIAEWDNPDRVKRPLVAGCVVAHPGSPGQRGPRGKSGERGAAGLLQDVIIN